MLLDDKWIIDRRSDMSSIRTAAVLVAAMTIVPVAGLASMSDGSQQSKAPAHAATAPAPAHATRGVIKSIDDTKLVIGPSSGKGKERTFVLNSATERQGELKVGSPVQVRYRTEGGQQLATAVSVQQSKPKAASKTSY